MSDYNKSEGYIFANLCENVSRALYEAARKKGWTHQDAETLSHGGNITLRDIANHLSVIGAHMEVTVKFIDDPVKGGKNNA
jgi:hypothetical protein